MPTWGAWSSLLRLLSTRKCLQSVSAESQNFDFCPSSLSSSTCAWISCSSSCKSAMSRHSSISKGSWRLRRDPETPFKISYKTSTGLARPSLNRISDRVLACWTWKPSSFSSSSAASLSSRSFWTASISSSLCASSLSLSSRRCFTSSISLSLFSCCSRTASAENALSSTPLSSCFSIFLCHTKAWDKLASPKGFSSSSYPTTLPVSCRTLAMFCACAWMSRPRCLPSSLGASSPLLVEGDP
mmetsp:Transcript_15366/g.39106  ORF Transcript_15366/g.39106 Transcript_15366/m.39106 type:complete len:242 (-) Transcript_15366:299-1024(-)